MGWRRGVASREELVPRLTIRYQYPFVLVSYILYEMLQKYCSSLLLIIWLASFQFKNMQGKIALKENRRELYMDKIFCYKNKLIFFVFTAPWAYRLGWSDLDFLRFSNMGTLKSFGYIFMSSIFKKIGEFSFFLNQRELENEYFLSLQKLSFYCTSKNNCH